MTYWPAARWKFAIVDRESERWVEPSLPFALIGSHPCCVGRINDPRVPPVTYFACCFEDGVEVWPVCPIAFPRWGLTLPDHDLVVGKKRVRFVHERHSEWNRGGHSSLAPSSKADWASTPSGLAASTTIPQITLDWDGKERTKTLYRRVMIIGGDHPSTIRLYQRGLARCDHAVVSYGNSVWLIDLNPDAGEQNPEKLVTQLTPRTEPFTIGQVKIGRGPMLDQPKRQTSGTSAAMGSRALNDSKDLVSATTPEAMTTQLTSQLVRIVQRRTLQRRIVVGVLYLIGVVIAVWIIVWIVFRLVIPLVTRMTG